MNIKQLISEDDSSFSTKAAENTSTNFIFIKKGESTGSEVAKKNEENKLLGKDMADNISLETKKIKKNSGSLYR